MAQALEAMLRQAAAAADWEQGVIRRCAWCSEVVAGAERVTATQPAVTQSTHAETHGMCEACARHALAQIAARPRRLPAVA